MKKIRRPGPLAKVSRKAFHGYPIGTVIFYGPDNRRASKVAASVILGDGEGPAHLERFFSEGDCRRDREIGAKIAAFFKAHGVKSVTMSEGILGCPHEEGIDYPTGEVCPQCPYWRGRNRFSGEIEH